MNKHTIWSNRNLNLDDWKDFLEEEHPLIEDEYEQYCIIDDMNIDYLYDERCNLNTEIDGRIIIIADLGLWDGRKQAYRILGNTISDILYFDNGNYFECYSDGKNIKGIESHHDGTNYYEYRVIREDRNIENLLDAIYNGEEISRTKLNYYTKSLHPYIAEIYGWQEREV